MLLPHNVEFFFELFSITLDDYLPKMIHEDEFYMQPPEGFD